ncbi:isoleucyl-tRNA synthetase [Pedobacter immunditicola]|uniref:isoleucyl-tRNA synthetase n=1 Tax=Pedobacter immunditicola TaxID=3133440 RepID=UPI0030A54DD5
MIKKLKLQKAVIVLIFGFIALVVYQVMSMREMDSSIYVLEAAGLLFMVGALMLLYPIVLGRKDKEGKVQLDPDKQVADDVEQ